MEAGEEGRGTCILHCQPEVCLKCFPLLTWLSTICLLRSSGRSAVLPTCVHARHDPCGISPHRAFHHHTCAAVTMLIAGIKARGPGKPVDMCDVLQVGMRAMSQACTRVLCLVSAYSLCCKVVHVG